MSEWTPKTAVITGGASGIGFAIASLLAKDDVQIILADLPGERLEAAGAAINAATHGCDVRHLAQLEALAESAFSTLGTVELLINNAGVGGVQGRLWEVDPDAARAHFDVNYWGAWNGCHAFAGQLAEQAEKSAIYNTGSENSFFCAVPQSGTYIAAKHALVGMTESLREDLPEHVHAGLIVPGWVFTPLGDERFMRYGMDVEQYAEIVVPQLRARRRFVVSHYSNVARIDERMDALTQSYEDYAFRDEGEGSFDVRSVMAKLLAK